MAHCDSAAGSPPSGVYVVARPGGAAATRIAATLVPAGAEIEVRTLTQAAGTLQVTGVGYSAATVPRCCPDVDRAPLLEGQRRPAGPGRMTTACHRSELLGRTPYGNGGLLPMHQSVTGRPAPAPPGTDGPTRSANAVEVDTRGVHRGRVRRHPG